jgi:hypothetical protein
MALKGHDRVWIGGLDIVESDDMATRSSEEFLVRGYAKAVHLWFGMLDSAGADAGESLPKPSQGVRKDIKTTIIHLSITYRMVWSYPAL